MMFDYTNGMNIYGANFAFKIRAAFLESEGDIRVVKWSQFSLEIMAEKIASKDDRPLPCDKPDLLSTSMDSIAVAWPWPAKLQKVTKFEFQYTQVSDRLKQVWRTLDDNITDNRYIAQNLKPMRKYAFRVRGFNFAGHGAFGESSDVFQTKAGAPSPPKAPFMVTSSLDSITVEWLDAESSDGVLLLGYEIAILTEDDIINSTTYEIPFSEGRRSHTETNVPVSEWCRFQVRSFNTSGFSGWSALSDLCHTKDATLNIPVALCTAAKKGLRNILELVNRSPLHDELQLRGIRTITLCFQKQFKDIHEGDMQEGHIPLPMRSRNQFRSWNMDGLVCDALELVRVAMTSHPENMQLQMWACKCQAAIYTFCHLCNPVTTSIQERLPWLSRGVKDSMEVIIVALAHHGQDKSVVQWSFACFEKMAELHPSFAHMFSAHPIVVPHLVKAMRNFPEAPNIITHSLTVLSSIACSTDRHDIFWQLGLPALTASCFSRYFSHETVKMVSTLRQRGQEGFYPC